jgi:hypothetical protein
MNERSAIIDTTLYWVVSVGNRHDASERPSTMSAGHLPVTSAPSVIGCKPRLSFANGSCRQHKNNNQSRSIHGRTRQDAVERINCSIQLEFRDSGEDAGGQKPLRKSTPDIRLIFRQLPSSVYQEPPIGPRATMFSGSSGNRRRSLRLVQAFAPNRRALLLAGWDHRHWLGMEGSDDRQNCVGYSGCQRPRRMERRAWGAVDLLPRECRHAAHQTSVDSQQN